MPGALRGMKGVKHQINSCTLDLRATGLDIPRQQNELYFVVEFQSSSSSSSRSGSGSSSGGGSSRSSSSRRSGSVLVVLLLLVVVVLLVGALSVSCFAHQSKG